jgi:phosphoglycolate phosphatase-like HAD superfamily hydrolase
VLVLFDIDGTLLSGATREHTDALRAALREVHGVDTTLVRRALAPAGRTDGEIARAFLLDAGLSAERIDERAADVREATARIYAEMPGVDLTGMVVPGVPALLDWLVGVDEVMLGLVTGNYEAVGRVKLSRAGLGPYFAGCPGAFGSDSEDRAALPAIARRRAGSVGAPVARAETVVIGDTPRDIACARADGVRCIAVATGPFRADQLTEADAVADDAPSLRATLAEWLGGSCSS